MGRKPGRHPVDRNPWVVVRARRKVKGKSHHGHRPERTGRRRRHCPRRRPVPAPWPKRAPPRGPGAASPSASCWSWRSAACAGARRPGCSGKTSSYPMATTPGWVTVRRSHRPIAGAVARPRRGPRMGPAQGPRRHRNPAGAGSSRSLVAKLRRAPRAYGEGPGGLCSTATANPSTTTCSPAASGTRAAVPSGPCRPDLPPDDPRQPKLARLRRHDLRHAACSWWLREGVDAVVCQRWSGHETLSVFLDIYQGVAPGREDDGVRKLVASVAHGHVGNSG